MILHDVENYFLLREKIRTDRTLLKKTTKNILENISNHNSDINAYLRVYDDEILDYAEKCPLDKNLSGLMVGIKDLYCYKDHVVEASSKILNNFKSQITATAVQRIIDNGGAIVGHQNCDQFGMGSANENSYYGVSRNGLDLKKSPGGSSGGSATAVQNNMCHVALGTDTGGSVRQPAAFCGIIGLKPTYGRISRYGVIPYSSSFDTVALLGKSIEDIALVLENIAGKDDKDCTSSDRPVDKYFENIDKINFDDTKISFIRETLEVNGLQREIYDSVRSLLNKLQYHGMPIKEKTSKHLDYFVSTYYVITAAEAAANLARFDGVRYGRCTKQKVDNLEEFVKRNRGEGFGDEVKKRVLFGNYVLTSEGVLEQAQKVRRVILNEIEEMFADSDFIILPTTPTTAFDLHRTYVSSEESYLADIFTNIASICGLPAISIPFGKDDNGLPIGIQIIAHKFEEQKLLSFAKKILTDVDFLFSQNTIYNIL